jgi:hypothetical protein
MRTNLWTMGRIVVALCLFTAGPAAADPASQPAAADWPQWRGPNRDGVVPAGPKLLDAWPANGPKLLWRSVEKIPSDRDAGAGSGSSEGGCGSISVSGGKAFLFAHVKKQISKLGITTEDLHSILKPAPPSGQQHHPA